MAINFSIPFQHVLALHELLSWNTCGIHQGQHHHDQNDRPASKENSEIIQNIHRVCCQMNRSYHGRVHIVSVQLQVDLLVNASLTFLVVVLTAKRHLDHFVWVESTVKLQKFDAKKTTFFPFNHCWSRKDLNTRLLALRLYHHIFTWHVCQIPHCDWSKRNKCITSLSREMDL